MTEQKPSLSGLVLELAPEMRRKLGRPPSPEELDAYADGDLAEEDAERIREHLTWNHESREVIRDLASFPDIEPPTGEVPPSESELQEAWQRLEERLEDDPGPDEKPGRTAGASVLPWRTEGEPRRVLVALAASFAVASVALTLWSLSLLKGIKDLSQPRVLDDIVGLSPAGTSVRGGEGPRKVPSGTGPLVWSLSLADLTHYRSYIVEIIDQQDAVVWQGRGSQRTAAGTVAVFLPRRDFLPRGDYRVLLYGANEEKQLLERYEIHVAGP